MPVVHRRVKKTCSLLLLATAPQAKQRKHHNGLFLIACARGLLSEAQQLLDMGAQPGTADKGGLSSAHFAAAHGKQEVLSFLWSKGVELDGESPGEHAGRR